MCAGGGGCRGQVCARPGLVQVPPLSFRARPPMSLCPSRVQAGHSRGPCSLVSPHLRSPDRRAPGPPRERWPPSVSGRRVRAHEGLMLTARRPHIHRPHSLASSTPSSSATGPGPCGRASGKGWSFRAESPSTPGEDGESTAHGTRSLFASF